MKVKDLYFFWSVISNSTNTTNTIYRTRSKRKGSLYKVLVLVPKTSRVQEINAKAKASKKRRTESKKELKSKLDLGSSAPLLLVNHVTQ